MVCEGKIETGAVMTEPTKKKVNKNKHKIADNRVAKKVDYTPEEQALIDNYFISSKIKPVKFLTPAKDQPLDIEGDGLLAVAKMAEAFGTPDLELHMFLLNQMDMTF